MNQCFVNISCIVCIAFSSHLLQLKQFARVHDFELTNHNMKNFDFELKNFKLVFMHYTRYNKFTPFFAVHGMI